jgi:hypothetical protein
MASYVLQPVWKEFLLFSYDSIYIYFVQCVEYKKNRHLACWFLSSKIWSLKNRPYTQILIWDNYNFTRTDNLFTQPLYKPTPVSCTFRLDKNIASIVKTDHRKGHAAMHRPNAHTTRLKILTLNFVEGVVSMRYLMQFVELCMVASRDRSILYDLS